MVVGICGKNECYRRDTMNIKRTLRLLFSTPISILAVALNFDVGLAQTGGYGGWHMGSGMMGQWGFGWFGGIFMIIFWIVVLAGLIFFIRWLAQSGARHEPAGSGADRAIEILRERYARGEISKEEFENNTKDITG